MDTTEAGISIAMRAAVSSSLKVGVLLLGVVVACGARTALPGDGDGDPEESDIVSALCEEFCEGLRTQCDYSGSCFEDCAGQARGLDPCAPELEAMLDCIVAREWDDPPLCTWPTDMVSCFAEVDALDACVHQGACEHACGLSGGVRTGSTYCNYVCSGVHNVSSCEHTGVTALPMICECQVDEQTVGFCQNVTGDHGYGFNCCRSYFVGGGTAD